MRKIKILKLRPNSRFHFGKPLIDNDTSLTDTDTYLHSDVLFSALVNNLASIKSKEEVDYFINAFSNGKIKISSVFYCVKSSDNSFTFLLPKPVNLVNRVDINDYDSIKLLKKVQFIDANLLGQNIESWNLDGHVALSSLALKKLNLNFRKLTSNKAAELIGLDSNNVESRFKLYTKGINTQVGLRSVKDEISETRIITIPKGPYQVSYIQIPDLSALSLSIHFYFLYEVSDSTIQIDFDLAVDLLQFNGIGGERSSGYGSIVEIKDCIHIPDIFRSMDKTDSYLGLSKIIPADKEELACIEAYTHCIRGGRNTHDLGVLRSVRMINEGSILSKPIKGRIADVSPDNSNTYLRSGKAIVIPLPDSFKIK